MLLKTRSFSCCERVRITRYVLGFLGQCLERGVSGALFVLGLGWQGCLHKGNLNSAFLHMATGIWDTRTLRTRTGMSSCAFSFSLLAYIHLHDRRQVAKRACPFFVEGEYTTTCTIAKGTVSHI